MKINKKLTYEKIREYYEKAKNYLDNDNWQLAFNTLYKEMPVELYDISIDLILDRNFNILPDKTKSLIELIIEVDLKLNPSEDENY